MTKVEALLNRIELIAKRLEMSVDDVISILEGKHPTHVVVQKYKEVAPGATANPPIPTNPPTAGAATLSSPTPSTSISSTLTASAPSAATPATNNAENPTLAGDAAASAGTAGQQAAGSTESGGVNSGAQASAAQNAVAAGSAPNNED
jgi:hypothetical protein